MFEPTSTWPNFTFGQLCMWIGAKYDQIWLHMGQTTDSEQCSNRFQLDLIPLLVNFSYELGQIMTRYYFIWARWVILSNVRTDFNLTEFHFWSTLHVDWGKIWSDMTSYGLDDWFWAMFEPTPTWPNSTFGQLFLWIGANNDQILLHMGQMSDSEQFSNRLQLDRISLLVNFSCGLGQKIIRYDFIWARRLILSNVRNDSNLT